MEPVADGVLLRRLQLGHGEPRRIVGQEERVVAKPMLTAPLVPDDALAGTLAREHGTRCIHERNHAHEARRPLPIGHAGELLQQLGVVRRIVTVHPGVARRVHARLAVQRIHHEAGIVGDG